MTGWKRIAAVFIDFHNLVVHEGISPDVAHKAFLAIDEYARYVSPGTWKAHEFYGDLVE